jgi:class 3 adenylate cyclase
MGDGVLVYFGYPQAHEDDAERAVQAGLACIDAIGRLDVKSVELQARVGIATGLVVVGGLIGEGSAQEQSVVGETPNLAAREGTARRARDPPVRYRDKPVPTPVRGPFSMPIRGPDCLPFDSGQGR